MDILLITTQYPCFDSISWAHTEYMHMYNREFVRLGNRVVVLHFERKYPNLFVNIIKLFKHFSVKINNIFELYTKFDEIKFENSYVHDGVDIHRFVINKNIPHGKFSHRSIQKAKRKINVIIKKDNIHPKFVILEFANPSLFFSDLFPETPLIFSPHGTDFFYLTRNPVLLHLAQSVEIILVKSRIQEIQLKSLFSTNKMIMLYGLVPFVLFQDKDRYREKIYKFITVSRLVPGKNICSIIDAFHLSGLNNFEYEIIGDGPDRNEIWNHIIQSGIASHCKMSGTLKKSEVIRRMQNSDCFIMISIDETFGLVYVEAMASGCVTIGSKNEGIDGVIVDGMNGYLCKAGDSGELANLIMKVVKNNSDEIKRISSAGYRTAKMLSENVYPAVLLEKISDALLEIS